MLDDFRFEQPDDGFSQCVIVAVPDASDRHVDSGFHVPIGVSDGQILYASVRVLGQGTHHGPSLADGLAEGVDDESGVRSFPLRCAHCESACNYVPFGGVIGLQG